MNDFKFVVHLKTKESLAAIEAWLDENCEGDCEIKLDSVAEDIREKLIWLFFENNEDCKRFRVSRGIEVKEEDPAQTPEEENDKDEDKEDQEPDPDDPDRFTPTRLL